MNNKTTVDLETYINNHLLTLSASIPVLSPQIVKTLEILISCITRGGKLLLCGNGGSAADSQHFAAELVSSMFRAKTHKALAAIALTTDTSIITSFANDVSFDDIFVRQLEALACKNDVVILFSTSGKSKNIIKAAEYAKNNELKTILFTGQEKFYPSVDVELNVQSSETHYIQEVHEIIYHFISAQVLNFASKA